MRFPNVVLLSACVLMLAFPLLAQSTNGVLNGLVVDPSNRAIVGAEILAVNDVTGLKFTLPLFLPLRRSELRICTPHYTVLAAKGAICRVLSC
jgi:hypothetical protein